MTPETWIPLAVGAVIVPSVAWLVNAVLNLQIKLAQIEEWRIAKQQECARHQSWQGELQKGLTRIDKNVTRLCEKAGVKESD